MIDPKYFAGILEGLLIPTLDWDNPEVPAAARDLAKAETAEGVPTGIAHCPEQGWFVIQTSGQGPYVIWP